MTVRRSSALPTTCPPKWPAEAERKLGRVPDRSETGSAANASSVGPGCTNPRIQFQITAPHRGQAERPLSGDAVRVAPLLSP